MQIAPARGNSRDLASAAGVLLRELIDYAGLFPPASLGMAAAVSNYEAYLCSGWNWVLGRFVVPVARLGEFEETFAGLPTPTNGTGYGDWRLSALFGSDPVAGVARIREFNGRMESRTSGRRAVVDSVEVKAASAKEITRLSEIVPAELATYFEIPLSGCDECIGAVAGGGRRAKIRTGGDTADKFPTAESVVKFICLCAADDVPFKATAGLHHPVRSVHRFTYQPDSPSGIMHGFLNVFLAAAFLRAGMEDELAVQLLDDRSAEALHFSSDEVIWRQHRLSMNEIDAARRELAISFGSCSFTEPIDDLRALRLV